MGIKREGFQIQFPEDEDFRKRFIETRQAIDRGRKYTIALMVVGGTIGLGFLAFICWAIYTVVMKFKGG